MDPTHDGLVTLVNPVGEPAAQMSSHEGAHAGTRSGGPRQVSVQSLGSPTSPASASGALSLGNNASLSSMTALGPSAFSVVSPALITATVSSSTVRSAFSF